MLPSSGVLAATDYVGFGASGIVQVISIILGLATLAAGIFVAVDANKYPDTAHQAAGAPKGAWIGGGIVGGILGLCCCFPLGLIVPILWFAVYKKKVEAGQGGPGFGGPPGGYGGPPPGGGYGGPPPGGGFGGPPPGGQPGGFPPPPPQAPPGGGYPPPPPPSGGPL